MFYRIIVTLTMILSSFVSAAEREPKNETPEVGFSIIKTAKLAVQEGLVYSGGSFFKKVDNNFSAILVKHKNQFFLFDTGLGSKVAEQYQQDMPYWMRPFFKYENPVDTARDQLNRAGFAPINQIILSHSHWDHASALGDFPDADVWVSAPEMTVIHHPSKGAGGSWPSQLGIKSIKWKTLEFKPIPYETFEQSLDLFGDGNVVLVPMYGHTPGSIGLFVTGDSGVRYFFIGDVVWNTNAVEEGRPKFWAARYFVDRDSTQTQHCVEQVQRLHNNKPEIIIVPAHDGAVQSQLGYFPNWVN